MSALPEYNVRIRPVSRDWHSQILRMQPSGLSASRAAIYERALNARDPRFDGVFFVGITSTKIYCRPVCPARVSHTDRRRFFDSAAAAERAGFRPCLRCRPELAPGRAICDAVSQLAWIAAQRIAEGALNEHSVADLARDLGISERHLRRALEDELGVSPITLAQTHRLLLAKQLLADTSLSVTRIAFASGFQSLRRFNAVFRECYRMSPSAMRRPSRANRSHSTSTPNEDLLRLTLAYRPPLAWDVLTALLARDVVPGVDGVWGHSYARTIRVDGHVGAIIAEDAATTCGEKSRPRNYLAVRISPSLLPVLMPLLTRLRRMFDLDARPTVVDAHLALGGLTRQVRQRPGLRLPGSLDGFEAILRVLLRPAADGGAMARRVVKTLGEPVDTGIAGLDHCFPSAAAVAAAGVNQLRSLGVSPSCAVTIVALARALADGSLRLEAGSDASETLGALRRLGRVGNRAAASIVRRALYWPDAFDASDRLLWRCTGVSDARALHKVAQAWRPWRAYAALHLSLDDTAVSAPGQPIGPNEDSASGNSETRPRPVRIVDALRFERISRAPAHDEQRITHPNERNRQAAG